jgi:hypothetical protein
MAQQMDVKAPVKLKFIFMFQQVLKFRHMLCEFFDLRLLKLWTTHGSTDGCQGIVKT